jgi:hypothetical protein
MKSKVFVKKLTLNKKTIANLKNGDMREVYGGKDMYPTLYSCVCSIPGGPCS